MIFTVFGILLMLSGLAGACLIAYTLYNLGRGHSYWCHTDRVDPATSAGNAEPHM